MVEDSDDDSVQLVGIMQPEPRTRRQQAIRNEAQLLERAAGHVARANNVPMTQEIDSWCAVIARMNANAAVYSLSSLN